MSPTQLRSPDEVHAYVRELSDRRPEDDRSVKAWRAARRLTWVALIAGSFLIYYLVSALNEMLSLPQVVISTPIPAASSNPPPSTPR